MNLLDATIVVVLVIFLPTLLLGLYFFWLQQQDLAEQNRRKSPASSFRQSVRKVMIQEVKRVDCAGPVQSNVALPAVR